MNINALLRIKRGYYHIFIVRLVRDDAGNLQWRDDPSWLTPHGLGRSYEEALRYLIRHSGIKELPPMLKRACEDCPGEDGSPHYHFLKEFPLEFEPCE